MTLAVWLALLAFVAIFLWLVLDALGDALDA